VIELPAVLDREDCIKKTLLELKRITEC
jgi:hypothetical protein